MQMGLMRKESDRQCLLAKAEMLNHVKNGKIKITIKIYFVKNKQSKYN